MKRIFVPSSGLSDWRRLLADPNRHWVIGNSAFEVAVSWERSQKTERGLPGEITAALDQVEDLTGSSLLIAFPEHKVKLNGGRRPSQNDVWALLTSPHGLISMTVEGK